MRTFAAGKQTHLTHIFASWQLGALQEVLEKLQAKRLPLWEKKFGQVPTVTQDARFKQLHRRCKHQQVELILFFLFVHASLSVMSGSSAP